MSEEDKKPVIEVDSKPIADQAAEYVLQGAKAAFNLGTQLKKCGEKTIEKGQNAIKP